MDFRQIEAFVNVIKYKSFSKAADASFLTQPTISIHINTLEKELNVKLIDRQGKEALPTKQGKAFYQYAISMLNTREKAIHSLQNSTANINGILEIQTSSIPGEYILPKLLTEFSKAYPDVKFYIEQSNSQTVVRNILENEGELGFTGLKADNRLTCIPFMKDEMVLIAPNQEKFKKLEGKPIRIGDFIKEPFILREQGSGTKKELEETFKELGFDFKTLNIVARMNSMEAIKQAVAGGLGVSIVSKIAADRQASGDAFIPFRIEGYDANRVFYLVEKKNVTLSPTGMMFKKFVFDYYAMTQPPRNNRE